MPPKATRQVVVESWFTGKTWRGEVEVVPDEDPIGELEQLFRYFNRVEPEDNTRLERIGFHQPSMSVGDMIELDGERWKCSSVGFVRA